MKKIPTIYLRDEANRRYVTDMVNPACEWVFDGEGIATRKFDGTCVRIEHWWYDGPKLAVSVRREVKPGKPFPEFYVLVETDPVTGKSVGWEPYLNSGYAKFIEEALGDIDDPDAGTDTWPEGTYELCGPKVNGNPEGFDRHVLVRHGQQVLPDGTPAELIALCKLNDWEGIVWHHPDGRMAKLKVELDPS